MLGCVATRLKSTKVNPFQFSSPMSATFPRSNFGSFSVLCLSSELCFSIKTQKKSKSFSAFCFSQSDSHLLFFRISMSYSELDLRRHAS